MRVDDAVAFLGVPLLAAEDQAAPIETALLATCGPTSARSEQCGINFSGGFDPPQAVAHRYFPPSRYFSRIFRSASSAGFGLLAGSNNPP